jgi:hypothetical protein
MAVSYDIDEVSTFLLSKGADQFIKNEDGFVAKFGLSGEKDMSSAAGMMEAFKVGTYTHTLSFSFLLSFRSFDANHPTRYVR